MAQALTLHPFGQFHRRSFGAPVRLAPQYGLPFTPRSITATPLVAWYDPGCISTLFTDTAGTVPVTADGDLVACMKDKSGNNNHATQSTSASRPIYRSAGYLDFDGTRFLFTAAIQITVTGQHSTGAAVYFTNNTGTQSVLDADNTSSNPRLSQLLINSTGTAQTIAFNTVPTAFTDSGPAITAATNTVLSEITTASSTEAFVNGVGDGSTAVTGTLQSGAVVLTIGCNNFSSPAQSFNGRFYGSAHYQGALSSSDHAQLVAYLTAKMASVSHDTTGALVGAGSTIAGTAVYNAVHPTTGALIGPSSTIVGSAARTREHATTGVLTGPGTTLAGVAVYNAKHATSGALTGQGSTIVGSAARTRQHDTTGILAGPGSVVVGVAIYNAKHTTTGALTGPGSTLAGSAARFRAFATSGVLVGPGSTIAGAALRGVISTTHATSGALVGQPSILTGTAARTRNHATSGILIGPPAFIFGNATRWRDHGSSGVLLGVTSVVFGRVFNGTPELQDIPVDSDNLVNETSPPSEDLGPITEPSGQIVNHPPYPAA